MESHLREFLLPTAEVRMKLSELKDDFCWFELFMRTAKNERRFYNLDSKHVIQLVKVI